MKNVRVCLIEDDDSIRESMSSVLEMEGYDVLAFENGKAAADFLNAPDALPHIIFLDLMMPIMNGWEFLKVAAKSSWKHLPIVVFSAAFQNLHDLTPAVAFHPKPISLEPFLDLVELHRRRDE